MEEFYENTQTETINGFEIPDCVIHSLAECLYSLMKEEYTASIGEKNNDVYATTKSATER